MIADVSVPAARRRWLPWLAVAATLLSLLASRAALIRLIGYIKLAWSYKPPLDPQEGFALWEVGLWRAGHGLYVPPTPHSFVSAPYPPLHPLLVALVGASDGATVFLNGRLVSLFAFAMILLGAVVLVRRVTGQWLAGIAAALLVASQSPFELWAMRIKPDLLGLALTVLGLAIVAPVASSGRPLAVAGHRRWTDPLIWAVPFVMAHFTKQTLVAGPLAAGTLLLLRDRRAAFRFGVAFVALLAVTWGLLDLVTHGQYTYHIWILHKLGWRYTLWRKLTGELRVLWPLMLLVPVGVVATWRRPSIITAYALWAPLSLLGAGVQGANHNHLLETGLALALAGGQVLGFGLSDLGFGRRGGWLALAAPVLAFQWLLLAMPSDWFDGEFAPDLKYDRYITFLQSVPPDVLADDVGLTYAAGHPLPYDDPSAMGPAARQGLWDESGMITDIKQKRFNAIILPLNLPRDGYEDPHGRWTVATLQAIDQNYQIKFADSLVIYVPR